MDDHISRRAVHRLIDNREYDLSNPIQKDLFHNAVNNLPCEGYDKRKGRKMDDLISRKWLLECVEEGWIKFDTEKDKDRYIHLIRDIVSTADVPHWIPCSEKVPEIEAGIGYISVKAYLVTMLRTTKDKKYSGIMVDLARFMPDLKDCEWQRGRWVNDRLVSNEKYDTEVIAWMPLPKPYNPIEGAMNPPEEEGDQKK